MNVVRGCGEGVLDEQPVAERMSERRERRYHCQEPRHDDGELDCGLTPLAPCDYRLFMPSDMASHSSCSFGRNTVMASIAMITSTPTKMAYSVVP